MDQTLLKWAVSLVSLSIAVHGLVACTDGDSTGTAPEQDAALDATTGDEPAIRDETEGSTEAGPAASPESGPVPSQLAVDGGTVDAGSDGSREEDATLPIDAGWDAEADGGDGATGPDALEAGDATLEACAGDACAGSGDAALDGDAPAEAGGDADAEAGDSRSTGSTLGLLKTILGTDCASCAQTNGCVGPIQTCDSLGAIADSGPGAGETLGQLCLDTLTCLAATRCGGGNGSGIVDVCYCTDTPLGSHCTTNGPCMAAEQKGLETTNDTEIYYRFYDPNIAGGVANNIVQCLLDSSCTTCFQ